MIIAKAITAVSGLSLYLDKIIFNRIIKRQGYKHRIEIQHERNDQYEHFLAWRSLNCIHEGQVKKWADGKKNLRK